MRILIVSNGYGEDQIACRLATALQSAVSNSDLIALPLVGPGLSYQTLGIPLLLTNPALPSGGFIRSFSDAVQDIRAGLFTQVFKQLGAVKNIGHIDLTISVGDLFCLSVARFFNPSEHVFLPTAKSDAFMAHSRLEIALMKRWAKLVFTRDNLTAESLREAGVPAHYLGNPMMDGLDPTHQTPTAISTVGLIPGSRQEAYENMAYILKVVTEVATLKPTVSWTFAKAPTFDLALFYEKWLKGSSWEIDETMTLLQHQEQPISIAIHPDFKLFLASSAVIIGLAGTANEQAVYVGKPVICFEGFGPQSTRTRFLEQGRLLGPQLKLIEPREKAVIAKAVMEALETTKQQTSTGELSDAAQKIVKYSLEAS